MTGVDCFGGDLDIVWLMIVCSRALWFVCLLDFDGLLL